MQQTLNAHGTVVPQEALDLSAKRRAVQAEKLRLSENAAYASGVESILKRNWKPETKLAKLEALLDGLIASRRDREASVRKSIGCIKCGQPFPKAGIYNTCKSCFQY